MPIYVPYYLQSVDINGSRLGGTQSISASRNYSETVIMSKGNKATNNFYKLPEFSISITRFLSDGYVAYLSDFNLSDIIEAGLPYTLYDINIKVNDGVGIEFTNALLAGASYSYNVQGFFTEQINFTSASCKNGGVSVITANNGNVKRRKDFGGATYPDSFGILQSADFSFNINHGTIPAFGKFNTYQNKYISIPVDISATFETLDNGASNIDTLDPSEFNDSIVTSTISINGPPSISIPNCFLISSERSGGDVGSSDGAKYRFTYKSNQSQFSIS